MEKKIFQKNEIFSLHIFFLVVLYTSTQRELKKLVKLIVPRDL